MLVREAVERFVASRETKFATDATIRWYGFMLKRFVDLCGHVDLARLDEDVIDTYVGTVVREEKNHAIKRETARGIIRALKNTTAWLYRRRLIAADVAAHIEVPKSHRAPIRALSLATVKALLDATKNTRQGVRDRAIIYVLLDTGCRVGGLIGLTPENLDFVQRRALVTEKGGHSRWVPFTAMTGKYLSAWLAVRPTNAVTVFCSLRARDRGATLTDSGVRLMLYRLSHVAKLKNRVSPHDFRHTLGSLYTAAGGPSLILRDVLGHTDVRTTQRYAMINFEEMQKAHDRYSPVVQLENLRK